ncbi:MAG: 1-deoxy-D-xylulose-5-phosphate reductoisomerase [Bacteroidales bacterium]
MVKRKKRIAILGSTGSIGTQALEVVKEQENHFEVIALTANTQADLLIQQAKEFRPKYVVIGNSALYSKVKNELEPYKIQVLQGEKGLCEVVCLPEVDVCLIALVGFVGLKPTIKAIQAEKTIALANKETLVVAGELVTKLAEEKNVNIYPVDSEHSAIFQCLTGEKNNQINKIYLTASGGPFRTFTYEQLKSVRKEQALKHPNWEMGSKITIDSASMMNKGLEVIEAKWLFKLESEQIKVIVHPQSIIHSLVEFNDGALKAQMGLPDMKIPILYAFSYPDRLKTKFKRFSFLDYPELTFEQADTSKFRCLNLAYEALEKGGNAPCILNAANEVVVDAFLKEKIKFLQIPELIEKCLAQTHHIATPNLEDLFESDRLARITTAEFVHKKIDNNK